MFTVLKFLLLAGGALFVVVFLASGAIGYLFYSSSSSSDIPPPAIPSWQEIPKTPREALIAGAIVLGAIWVLVGGDTVEKEEAKPDSKKGRRRRYLDED